MRLDAPLDLRQPPGVELDAIGVQAQRVRRLAELRGGAFEQVERFVQRRVVAFQRAELPIAAASAPAAEPSDSASASRAARAPSIRLAAWASRLCSA